ncbi:MAG: hypothetical protein QNJ16_04845 [Rhodobacter sp.]|nr:hypothetical protein [Rhodobacter sp.]
MSYWDDASRVRDQEHWSKWDGRVSRAERTSETLDDVRAWWADVRTVMSEIWQKLRGQRRTG